MAEKTLLIGDKVVGGESPRTVVVAEVGINHGGSLDEAKRLVDAAADCGADAVKFQTFRAERLLIRESDRYAQQGEGSESAYDMFRRLELGWQEHEEIKAYADARGILFFSTPFDEESVDRLDAMGVPAFKIASADITHFPLLKYVAAKRKPVLLSTGMSYFEEVSAAVRVLQDAGAADILLLHCVSSYPALPDSLNLRAIATLKKNFDLPIGYSDHSQGIMAPLLAVALGAQLIEKHFTLDKKGQGPDHGLSSDPCEMSELVRTLRTVEKSLGDGRKTPCKAELDSRIFSRRSIVAAMDIKRRQLIQPGMLTFKRPGTGLAPCELMQIVGMRARTDISRDSIVRWEDLLSLQPTDVTPRPDAGSSHAGSDPLVPDISEETPHE